EYPAIDLYTNDGSHPSAAGSYLAACVFYSSMYRKSTIGNSYHFSLDAATALTLQTIASETVLDSLDMWRIGANDISLELTNDTASCTATSIELIATGMYETISWQDNSTDTFFVAMQSGVYTATVSNVHGCEISKSTNVSLGESLLDTIHITGCDSVEVFGDYYHTDTAVVDTFMQGNGCDSIVVVYIEMDTTTETTIHFQQTFPVKKNYVGIIFEYYVSFGDSIAITDSLYQTIYSSTELNEHGYIYVCDSNTISDLYHLIVYKPCKNDTVDLFAYCSAVSIDDLDYTQWTISPNPTNDIINIHSQEKEGFAIAIFDVIGNEILVKRRTENNELTVDISNWSKGIYYLMIYDENDVPIGQTKIMKQ
ncbi:MAG: T9SS type A sorting domain-containing protein, partial [Chitinophagales bacterium]